MILLLSLQATPTFAQNDDFVKQFQQARQGMMDDYNQQLINAAIDKYNYEQQQPLTALSNYNQLIQGSYGGTTTSTAKQNTGSTSRLGNVLGGGLSGAATGAMIGSAVPGIGTALGATLGGIGGGLLGLF